MSIATAACQCQIIQSTLSMQTFGKDMLNDKGLRTIFHKTFAVLATLLRPIYNQ